MKKTIIVVVKAFIVNKGKVLIVKRAAHDDVGGGSWETVGGKIEFGENLEQALIREVQEEAGIAVQVEDLLYATTFLTNPCRQIVLLTYLCRTDAEHVLLSSEHSQYLWAAKSELYTYLPSSIIQDLTQHRVLEREEISG